MSNKKVNLEQESTQNHVRVQAHGCAQDHDQDHEGAPDEEKGRVKEHEHTQQESDAGAAASATVGANRHVPAEIADCRLLGPEDYRVVADLFGPCSGFAFLILNCAAGELQELIAESDGGEPCYVEAYVVPAYDADEERVYVRLDVGAGGSRISLAFDAETNRTGLTLLPGCLYLVFSKAPAAVLDGVVVSAVVSAVGGTAHGETSGREVAPLVDGGKLRQALDDYGGIAVLRIERVWKQLAHAGCLAQATMHVLRDEYVIWCAPEPSGSLHRPLR